MTPAPIPKDDAQRLKALHDLLIPDTLPEERFDRIVAFAAEEFDVPIVLVSLVDRNRQWLKARIGLEACETSRDISFCGHAVVEEQTLVIPDALDDPRFADNPLVTGPPFIRFDAGAQLRVPGSPALGTLCLMSLVRSTVVAVARQMNLASIEETSSIDVAEQRLARARFDGLLLSLDDPAPALALLGRLRAGEFNSSSDLPVILMTSACDAGLADQVRRHGVLRLLIKPFKLKLLLQTVEALSQQVRDSQPA